MFWVRFSLKVSSIRPRPIHCLGRFTERYAAQPPIGLRAAGRVLRSGFMQVADIFLGLGEYAVAEVLRGISLGKLKTYQLFERVKTRLHVTKLNSETLRKIGPRVWGRLHERDDEF